MQRDLTRIRNIGIMASVDAGNTQCRERLFEAIGGLHAGAGQDVYAGRIHPAHLSPASSGDWTARSGPFAEETTTLAIIAGGSSAVDGALIVLDGSQGAESAEPLLREMILRRLPGVVFVDDLGRPEDLEAMVDALEADLGWTTVTVHLPWNDDRGVHVIDVLEQRLVVESNSGEHERRPISAPALVAVRRLRQRVIDVCAEVDESIQGAQAMGLETGAYELARALRKAVLARGSRVLVVTCGSLRARRGASLLLDALVTYLPSPAERPPVFGVDPHRSVAVARFAREGDGFSARVFAATDVPILGRLTWIRIHSGTIGTGATMLLLPRGEKVQAERIFEPDARGLLELGSAGPGAVVCVSGVVDARPGDTLSCARAPIMLDDIPSASSSAPSSVVVDNAVTCFPRA